ncbi:hypothetical protein F4805DRAFT_289461 [Annulohypoxylon moriforme]|nr:hypothetical protein F4805DRAFT_289461 [Annulohypoxylon moriforme]
MPSNTGLRLARVHPLPFNRGFGSCAPAIAPLFTTTRSSQVRKRIAPPQLSSSFHRTASTASEAKDSKKEQPPSITEATASPTRPTSPLPPSSTLNPPASTRPPPLELPTRDPSTSTFTYWFQYGKAYTTFYKTGLRAIFTNRTLLVRSPSTPPSSPHPTRSDILLRSRVHHDLYRVPTFGLLLIICGELTPLIVIAFPKLTPYTCRIPKQVDALRRRSEARRGKSFRALRRTATQTQIHSQSASLRSLGNGHICRSLGLTNPLWDRIGLDSPFSSSLATRAVARIAEDDGLLRDGGGVEALVDEEVVLACEDRGVYVQGKSVAELRAELGEWLRKTTPRKGGSHEEVTKEVEDKVRGLLLGLDGGAAGEE